MHKPAKRSGFTLIELLMVIVIISALIALLFPAISSIRNNMRVAEVRTEISQIESAIADFNLKFGSDPPSQIILFENGSAWFSNIAGIDVSGNRAKMRRLWPKFDFSQNRDFNGDGDSNDYYLLKGDQAVVFFLGGVWDPTKGFQGFSGDPTRPFGFYTGSSGNVLRKTWDTSIGPFFSFDSERVLFDFGIDYQFWDNGSGPAGDCSPFFPVYVDPLPEQTRPYIYTSSYGGLGYNDGPNNQADANTFAATAERPNGFRAYQRETGGYWKPKKYQIISPGWDGLYGEGGVYNPDAPTELPPSNPSQPRTMERDNVTNFASGLLVP